LDILNINTNSEQATLEHDNQQILKIEALLNGAALQPKLIEKFKAFSHFFITAAIIFVITFVALNFSAYKKQILFYLTNGEANLLQQQIVENTAVTEPMRAAATIGSARVETSKIPTTTNSAPVAAKTNTPIFAALPNLELAVSPPDNRVIIPRYNIHAPIIEADNIEISLTNWEETEKQIQAALEHGAVHFPGTARPGDQGNAFITGHSSFYPWSKGDYKDVFALLPKVEIGDDVFVWQDQHKYHYRVTNIKEVKPSETNVLEPSNDYRLTLMTCTPLGTTLRRLIVTSQLVERT
jgi:LPXTG-site transpeptidase (sortase) family protein